MKHQELRNLFEEHFSSKGIEKYKNYSVINKGFPGNFNLSFSEPEMIDEFGSLINIKHRLQYTKIQPCIRLEDFVKILVPFSKNFNTYLGVFDMAGVCLCFPSNKELSRYTEKLIKKTWDFLITKLKLSPKKLFVKCFWGGNIKEITRGKYNINKEIGRDSLSISKWKQLGIPEKNIIKDHTRDTLLALNIYQPTPWGFRTEILYKIDKDYLDIGTIESFPWKPVFKKGRIGDIGFWGNSCCLAVFGLERLNFLINNLNDIYECDIIKPLFDKIIKDSKIKDKSQAFLLTECIRTSQRILTDSQGYKELSRHRKKKLTKYVQQMFKSLERLKIPHGNLEEYLKINATSQPWYSELKKNIGLVNKELLEAFSRKF